ncbi:hypothetical protein HYH03_000944 [Edaphochlamys debaryana]|uniref:TROVE domain-containing protein n=1 Tax=Edaphochlamys debaryana TaxID=47281 RepID=A0A835YHM9_9CHLO|nr:hypothetical protein HYH03_000944 [Edaphochlamys debaryana]|eukprot:KAG2501126.1 hypothetical protein HYH03_000944 [Edaphochlamys debaryana]
MAAPAAVVAPVADVPQSEPISDSQVRNNAGGFVYQIDDLARLRRFVILGSDANNYYVDREELTLDYCEAVLRLLAQGQGERVVQEVRDISTQGRAPRQGPGILVLALCARLGDAATRSAALASLAAVCRTGSTLFEMVQRCKELGPVAQAACKPSAEGCELTLDVAAAIAWSKVAAGQATEANADMRAGIGGRGGRGGRSGRGGRGGGRSSSSLPLVSGAKASWGRGMRSAVANWYLAKAPAALAYQVTKYSQRNGWSHGDLLRLAHPDPEQHAAKKRRLAEAKTAEATVAETKPAAESEDWVLVDEDGGAAGSELAALAAASAAAAGPGAATSAAEAEAQRVADTRAIFAYVTHSTLPGQPPAPRKGKGKGTADPAVPAASDSPAPTAATDPAPSDAPAAAAATTPALAPLSPVMQYLVDAQRLRKEIRAPPPLVKRAEQPEPAKQPKPAKQPSAAKQKKAAKQDKAAKRRRGQEPGADSAAEVKQEDSKQAAHAAAHAAALSSALELIRRHRFGHEHVGDTTLLRCPEVWSAFLENGMPLTALVRNLGRLTQLGLMRDRKHRARVTQRLGDAKAVAAARLHPMSLLDAMCTYRAGRGAKGVARWEPEPAVVAALEAGFYLAFKNCTPTGKRYLLGLDVSGSMGWCKCVGMTSVTPRQASAAVAMSLVRAEPWVKTLAFSHRLVPMELSASDRLEEVIDRASAIPMGGTDCALPMLHALEKRLPVDVFVVLTDNETWYGSTHPSEALRRYRAEMGMPDAKLVVLAFSSTGFSIADPTDPGMLDVAGLDSAVPKLVADFVSGRL